MKKRNPKRRIKKRKAPGEKTRMKFGVIIGIMLVAVFLGFLTARFVVGPIIGYDSDTSPVKTASTEKAENESKASESSDAKTSKEQKIEKESENDDVKGYALQFGAFSTEEAAEELSKELKGKGIKTEIIKYDSMYKVISPLMEKKDDALDELDDVADKDVEDVFIAKF